MTQASMHRLAQHRAQSWWPAVAAVAVSIGSMAWAAPCPSKTSIGGFPGMRFEDESFAFRSPLNVNPDGAKASYTVGDHGYTYISNGMNRRSGSGWASCVNENKLCSSQFKEAEDKAFGPGSPEFCAFALEVEPIPPQTSTQECGDGRKIIGNGKGRPILGPDQLGTVEGGKTSYYKSMTHLNQQIDKKRLSVDSMIVPMIVVPASKKEMLGRIAYVTFQGKSTLAVVGDTGPDLGEGSIALHELLVYGALQDPPPIGPIKLADRCGPVEMKVKQPYAIRPDTKDDLCKPGRKMQGAADIRGYGTIPGGVVTVVLGKARLPMLSSTLSKDAITLSSIKKASDDAGYTAETLDRMAQCLKP